MCSARWSGCLMLPFRLTLLKCESDQVWLVIWPRRQGAEGFSESQSAACGTSVQERSQEAFGVLSLELTGWPTKFEIFLAPYFHCHLLFFFFFSFSIRIFFSNLGNFTWSFVSFFSVFAPLCFYLSGRDKQKNHWWDILYLGIWFLSLLLEFIIFNADKVYQIPHHLGRKQQVNEVFLCPLLLRG